MRHEALNFLAARQDYFWFVALLVWLVAGVLWWRWARDDRHWRWLGFSAVAGIGTCAGELAMLAIPVAGGPQAAPHLAGDLWLGVCLAVQAAGWWQTVAGSRAASAGFWVFAAGLATARYSLADEANLALALLVSAAALAWSRRLREADRETRVALAAAWLAACLASCGPLADALEQRRRWMEISHAGLFAAIALGTAGLAAAVGLARAMIARWPAEVRLERQADIRALGRRGAGWLLAGFLLSALAGNSAQRTFERSALTRLHAMSLAFERHELERCLGPELRIESTIERRQPSGRRTVFGVSQFQAGPEAEPVRRKLRELRAANPDARNLRIRTFRDGYVLLGPGARQEWLLTLEHAISDADRADWRDRVGDFRGMVYTSYDEVAQARWPLLSPQGEMLGWLVMDLGTSAWMAAQTQARGSIYAVVGLGLGVLALWCVQRWRERERAAAKAAAALATAADRLKVSFLAKVSHELRTPLQGILGFGELAHATASDPRQIHQLESLLQHGRLLTRLVNDLIDLSAVEAGGLSLRPAAAPVPEFLTRPVSGLLARAKAKGLELAIETNGPAGVWVLVDAERASQIALNLVGNAIKFTDSGRVVVHVGWENTAEHEVLLQLDVRDSGPGIAPDQRARLFQPFSRLHAGAGKEGAGLGLAIAQGLCQRMGGQVELLHTSADGTVFRATLRLPSTEAPRANEAIQEKVHLRGCRILVADDNPLLRELFVTHLSQLGADCTGADDGEEAWECLQRKEFDVVVADLSMPVLDGLALARRVRAGPGRRPRLVAASAHAGPGHRQEAIAAGFDDFLGKPVPLGDLVRAVAPTDAAASPSPLEQLRQTLREQFRKEIAGQAESLRRHLAQENWPAVQRLAHYLRNSAFAVDDQALAAALNPLELAAAAAQPESTTAAWPGVAAALTAWLPPDAAIHFPPGHSGPAAAPTSNAPKS